MTDKEILECVLALTDASSIDEMQECLGWDRMRVVNALLGSPAAADRLRKAADIIQVIALRIDADKGWLSKERTS